jgi:thiosulfate reductase cytochrome b subunit
MGGTPTETASQSAGSTAPAVQAGAHSAAQDAPARGDSMATNDVPPTPTPAVAAPKRRMGGAPAAQAPVDSAPAAGSGGTGPATRKRMGNADGATATGGVTSDATPRRRMGGAPATAAAVSNASGSNGPVTAAPAVVPSASSTTSGAAASVPVGRAGTPGPAGAATPAAPQRPWVKPVVITVALVVVAALAVLGARWLRTLEGVQEFIATYDGHASQPVAAPEGMPWWLGWQHFFNMFFIVLIIRTGLQVRTERKPPGYWTANKDSFFSPAGNTPKKVSLSQWLHQCLDVLWVVNGIIFVVLLFGTGHWMRIVPTSWDVFPNMVSGAIQYASLDWPTENGWVHYNALQVMAYFTTVFIAAPLAIATGIRISTWWPERVAWLNRVYPVEWARAVHFPVMLYFVAFTIVHVFLVFFTGALANLNHMYTSRDVVDWWGLVIFLASLVVIAAAWFLTKPMFTTPIAARMGKVSK